MIAKVLAQLRKQPGQWVSMEHLRAALSLSAGAVHEYIEGLGVMGHQIEMGPMHGFRLLSHTGPLSSELLSCGLGTERVGRKVLVYRSTGSTNEVAWHYAESAGYDGLAVFAEEQRAGRGRLGRQWLAPAGSSVLCSVLLGDCEGVSGSALTLLAGLSVVEAVENACGVSGRIKWPNDVTISAKKLAGIMIESRVLGSCCRYVIGVGINCQQQSDDFPVSLRDTAISVSQAAGAPTDRLILAQELLRRLDYWLCRVQGGQGEQLHSGWLSRCDDLGRRVTVVRASERYSGRVMDVSCERGLVLQLDDDTIEFFDAATTTVAVEAGRD